MIIRSRTNIMDLDREFRKQEGSDTTEYFYDGTAVLYTKDKNDAVSSFNLIGAEDNILSTARPGEGDAVDFYTYNGIYAL